MFNKMSEGPDIGCNNTASTSVDAGVSQGTGLTEDINEKSNALQQVLQMLIDTPGGVEAMAEVLNEPNCPVVIKDGHFMEKPQDSPQGGCLMDAVQDILQMAKQDPETRKIFAQGYAEAIMEYGTQKEKDQLKNLILSQLPSTDRSKISLIDSTKKMYPITESMDDPKLKLESLGKETGEVWTIEGPKGAKFPYLKIKVNPKFDDMYTIWNEDSEGHIYNEVKYSTLQNTLYQIKKYKEQSMNESVISTEKEIIHYDDLTVQISTGSPSGYFDTAYGNWLPDDSSKELEVDWDYELPKADVIETLRDIVAEEESNTADMTDEQFEAYVNDNYDSLFTKYEDRLKDYYREAAEEDAEENGDWDDDYYECLSEHYDQDGHYIFKDFRDAKDVELKDFWDEPKEVCEEKFLPVDTKLEMEGLDAYDPEIKVTDYEWAEEDPETSVLKWEEVASKDVFDSDGFLTTYKWFKSVDPAGNETHIFMFNDDEADPDYADYECHNTKEAQEWFNSYTGCVDVMPEFDDVTLEDTPVQDNFTANDNLNESYMSDLDIDVQDAGSREKLIKSLERDVFALQSELDFLTTIAPREVGAGGNFDSMEEIQEAVKHTESALRTAQAKLRVLKEVK